ncbi:type II toxin-antitoxin system RelE/ParE family toxin [Sphingomonas profundi]|uniref:type II toxin-antitoxin system RelE/ParE family toxin n=1 Tax=Alterirhizorhabdus profundi TaxID=2681549 RepID=UPI0018D085D9|nr:type II toxin-antitoxin system RelE/ParE family toxin [Sphingomonas profundi]
MKLVLSNLADADINGIAEYSLRQWGVAQARHYSAGLTAFLEDLRNGTVTGSVTLDTPSEVRRGKYRSHFIFFRRSATDLLIVRVLHERMDHLRHLR